MKHLFILLLLIPALAQACNISEYLIAKWVQRKEVVIAYKPNGEVLEVTCNAAKLGAHVCQHRIEQIFAFYKK